MAWQERVLWLRPLRFGFFGAEQFNPVPLQNKELFKHLPLLLHLTSDKTLFYGMYWQDFFIKSPILWWRPKIQQGHTILCAFPHPTWCAFSIAMVTFFCLPFGHITLIVRVERSQARSSPVYELGSVCSSYWLVRCNPSEKGEESRYPDGR